jgi:hypothetical protein
VAETLDCLNNIIYNRAPDTSLNASMFELVSTGDSGTLNLGVNWISPGYFPGHVPWNGPFTGRVTGQANVITNPENQPGFTNLAGRDFNLAAGSQGIDAGVYPNPMVPAEYQVSAEYADPRSGKVRTALGSGIDLGAFEFTGTQKRELSHGQPLLCAVFPNPASGCFSVQMMLARPERVSVKLINLKGQAVFNQTWVASPGLSLRSLSASRLPQGIYLSETRAGERVFRGKVMVRR